MQWSCWNVVVYGRGAYRWYHGLVLVMAMGGTGLKVEHVVEVVPSA